VQVNVEHRLACVAVRIEYGSETAGRKASLFRDGRRPPHQLANELIVFDGELIKRGDVALRHHQHVSRRLRVDVVERQHPIVFVHDRTWDLPVDDLAEKAVGHALSF
jgi:hypothetical protein